MMRKFYSLWISVPFAWRFAFAGWLVTRVILILWSLVVYWMFPVAIQNLDLFGEPVLTIFNLSTSERFAYSRTVDGTILKFQALDDSLMADQQTGSVWSMRDGEAIQGSFVGVSLEPANYNIERIFPYLGVRPVENVFLSLWQRFDANWYGAIASFGYGHRSDDIHFPPLYPLLIRILLPFTGHPIIAGLMLSHIFTFLMLVEFYKFVRQIFGDTVAERSVIYLMVYPTSFFFFSAYTEGLFILLVLLFFGALQDGRLHHAGLWAFFAILTRLQGVALFLPLGFILFQRRKSLSPEKIISAIGYPAIAIFLYLYLRLMVGNPSVIPFSETNLHARQVLPWENYWEAVSVLISGHATMIDILNLIFAMLFLVLIFMGWRRFDTTLNIFSAVTLVILTSRFVDTQPLNSTMRYTLTIFPVFILLANYGINNPMFNRLFFYTCLALSMYLSAQFILWGWVG
jgi:Gpi18-like mannosyltransferase